MLLDKPAFFPMCYLAILLIYLSCGWSFLGPKLLLDLSELPENPCNLAINPSTDLYFLHYEDDVPSHEIFPQSINLSVLLDCVEP